MGAGNDWTIRGIEDELFGTTAEGGLEIESQPGFALMGTGVPSSCKNTATGFFFADFDLDSLSFLPLFPEETTTGGVGETPADSILTLSFSRSPSTSLTSWQRMEDDDADFKADGSGFGSENFTALDDGRPGVLDGDLSFGREGVGDRVVVTKDLEASVYR